MSSFGCENLAQFAPPIPQYIYGIYLKTLHAFIFWNGNLLYGKKCCTFGSNFCIHSTISSEALYVLPSSLKHCLISGVLGPSCIKRAILARKFCFIINCSSIQACIVMLFEYLFATFQEAWTSGFGCFGLIRTQIDIEGWNRFSR